MTSKPSRVALLTCLLALTAASLSGCFGEGDSAFAPGSKYKETGRTVHLKATVVDLPGQDIYPGFKANLWAYCFAPVDPTDAYSAAAVEPRTPLAGDVIPPGWEPGQCGVPGPNLRVHQGDRVKVEFSHSHFHPHTIHWHGQFVPFESDGVPGGTQDTVSSGGSFTYDFIAKKAGTLWYHCHVDTQLHVMQGLYGVIIVEPQDDSWEPKDLDKEYSIVISSMRRDIVEAIPGTGLHSHPPGCASGFVGCENPPAKVQPDVFLFNGHSLPYTLDDAATMIHLKEGERIRLRMVNAGTTVEEMHPHGHDMQVIAKDGNPIRPEDRLWVDTLIIGPGERYDVLLEGQNPGVWAFHTHMTDHETNCWKAPGGMHTMILYEGYEDKMGAFKGEALATCPYGSQLQLPGDFTNHSFSGLGGSGPSGLPLPSQVTGTSVNLAWSWPVELPCAVRRLDFQASLATTTAGAPLTSLQVEIKDQTGAQAAQLALDPSQPHGNYTLEAEGLRNLPAAPGNYTALVSGDAYEASLDLNVVVDYYESFEQTKVGHLVHKVGGCPGYT